MNKIHAAVIGVALSLVGVMEGVRYTAYQDAAGVWTICNGVTAGVKRGDTATPAYCKNTLLRELVKHSKPFEKLPKQVPDNVQLAVLDWAYNTGIGGMEQRSVYKYLELGNWKAACSGLLDWRRVRINGVLRDCSLQPWYRKCGGVYERRLLEYRICTSTAPIDSVLQQLGVPVQPDGGQL